MATSLGSLRSGGVTSVQSLQSSTTSATSSATATSLGGIQSGNGNEKKNVKDKQLPDGLNNLVNQLKDYIKKQKSIKDEIERQSIKSFKKVSDETSKLRKDVSWVSSSIQKDASAVESLKSELSQELINAEVAQQTSNTPLAFQHENMAPREYYQRLIESFEERMFSYRRQVEEVESHLASLQKPQSVSPQEISIVMKKLHETFITLAARMHETHEAVKLEKERYLAYRERVFGDRTNVFEKRRNVPDERQYTSVDLPRTTLGPSPFNLHNNVNRSLFNPVATLQGGVRMPATGVAAGFGSAFGNTSSLAANSAAVGGFTPFGGSTLSQTPFGTSTGLGTSSGFGLTNSALGKSIGSSGFGGLGNGSFGTTFGGSTSSLQLQKPPAGGKRGKNEAK
ncbi:nucleoporin p58/p45-like [Dendronephthya gigantea]|uniref:nucleoporin p58/p45-like n=1 Tax=Dendronephthya gigantea TaxID=151771 RepID=UPI00106CF535|nr:nucleoporin p58/p45-like [Dendronephthya gigantea]